MADSVLATSTTSSPTQAGTSPCSDQIELLLKKSLGNPEDSEFLFYCGIHQGSFIREFETTQAFVTSHT